jgi:adenylyltransferase/sulfurtransferase
MVDAWGGSTEQVRVEKRPDCEVCGRRRFAYLEEGAGSRAATLCGRQAVQVSASDGAQTPPFEELAGRLSGQGDVTFNRYVLRFRAEGFEIELFRDARAIVKGTSDPATARSLYARYIGI